MILARHMEEVARRLLGEPNKTLSKKTELRYGTHGSLSINLIKGTWFDHENQTGGGVITLIARVTGANGTTPLQWLKTELGIELPAEAKQPVAVYPYTDEHGNVLFEVVRFEPKQFSQRRPNGNGEYTWNLQGVRRVPFHLPQLLSANGRLIYIVEGEKDVLTLERHGIVATTNAEGSGKWRPEFADFFHGADVAIIPDNDEPGEKHARAVLDNLQRVASRVRIVRLPNLKPKGDVTDWLRAGGTVEELAKLCDAAETGREKANDKADSDPAAIDSAAVIAHLATLTALEYDRVREAEAKALGIRVKTLDKLVSKARGKNQVADTDSEDDPFDPIHPWPEFVEGADLLDQLATLFTRHLILPPGAADAMALWVLHAHAHDTAAISPILAITSPTPECGKTSALTLLGALVPRPLTASNITAPALFRAVEKWSPTLLVDEADTFLANSDELRGIINSGHNRGAAFVIRTVGDDHEPRRFRTWAPKAIALIGTLPATLASRSIHIEMKRLAPGETVDPVRPDRLDHLVPFAQKAARWAAALSWLLRQSDPAVPTTFTGRRADNWRPLFAIADSAGLDWPSRARNAAMALTGVRDEQTAGVMLLGDIRHIMGDIDKISSKTLAEKLGAMIDRPWPEWKNGKPITERGVAKLLGPFSVGPKTIRIAETTAKGYLASSFADAWVRYLAPDDPSRGNT